MKIINIMLNDLRVTSKDKLAMVLLTIMPVVMIFIMGYALKSTFEPKKDIDRFSVLYYNGDMGLYGRSFDSFIRGEGGKLINLVNSTPEELEKRIGSGEYSLGIEIPSNMSANIDRGKKVTVNIVTGSNDPIEKSILRSMVDSFAGSMNNTIAISSVYREYAMGDPSETSSALPAFAANNSNFIISKEVTSPDSGSLSSYQYFAASMLLFFMLTTGIGIGSKILTEKSEKIYMRMMSFPITKGEYLLGKILGNGSISIMQALIIILLTRYLFKVDWGTNIIGISIVVLLMMFISSSLGIIFSGITSSPKIMSSTLTIFLWLITFFSGGFSPLPVLDKINNFIFYKWAFNSLSCFMNGGRLSDVTWYLGALLLVNILLWITGITIYNRRVIHE